MPIQSAVSIRAPIRAGAAKSLTAALGQAHQDLLDGRSALTGLDHVHFARFLVIPGDTTLGGAPAPDTLAYMADVDGSPAAHVRALSHEAGVLIDSLFSFCARYPSAPDAAQRLTWLRQHQVTAAAAYVNTVGLGVRQIVQEAVLYDWLESYLDEHHDQLAALRPVEIHRAVRRAVGQSSAVEFATHPAPPITVAERVRAAAEIACAAVLLIVALPVVLVVGPFWLIGIRRLEATDPQSTEAPSDESVNRLRAQEDQFAYNPFVAVGVLKTGRLRHWTVTIVLRAIAFAVRHVFARGSLAGVRTIHFARWVRLDDNQRVIFTSEYDGSLESYMDDFIDKLAWGLNIVFSNGIGYPRTRWLIFRGARNEQLFKNYLRCHQLETAVSFSAYPTLTMANVLNNAAIRAGLARDLNDRDCRTWLARL